MFGITGEAPTAGFIILNREKHSMRAITVFLVFLGISMFSSAVPVQMVAPFQQTVNTGDEIYIGAIGPGQTLEVRINPIVTEGGIYGAGGSYDFADVTSKPALWSSTGSTQYQDPLQVKITADKDAPEGTYRANITVSDENNGEELGNVTFTVRMNITWDVLDVSVTPSSIMTGPGQPARFTITVQNKGSASDAFTVSSNGTKKWSFEKPIYVPAKSSRAIVYEMTGFEEEFYKPTIRVVSDSSPNIFKEKNVTMTVQSGLIGDYKSTSNGVMIFPVYEAPVYSLAGIIGAILGALGI